MLRSRNTRGSRPAEEVCHEITPIARGKHDAINEFERLLRWISRSLSAVRRNDRHPPNVRGQLAQFSFLGRYEGRRHIENSMIASRLNVHVSDFAYHTEYDTDIAPSPCAEASTQALPRSSWTVWKYRACVFRSVSSSRAPRTTTSM